MTARVKDKIFRFSICFLIIASLFIGCENGEKQQTLLDRSEIPYLAGESRTIIDPKPGPDIENSNWFANDHCFVTDHEGRLHWIGINNPFPPEGKKLYRYHPYLGHLITDNPMGNWKRLPFALDESEGTEYLGAPFIVWHEESQRWVMVVETYLDSRRLEVCWSDDLTAWERTKKAILPEALWISTRDPHIMKGADGKYWIHVVSAENNGLKQSQVLRIKTSDFVHFEDPLTIMAINDNDWETFMESPFVLERNGLWYLLFTYAHRRYTETLVIVSDNPNQFDYEQNCLTTLFGHAAEIFTYNNKTYISSCGPEDHHFINTHGVTLAELKWADQ